jgi:hypothetical protein
VIHHIVNGLAHLLTLHNIVLPSIERPWHDGVGIRVLVEQIDDTSLHVVALNVHLAVDVVVDVLLAVASVDQVLAHCLGIPHVLISAHNNVSLSLKALSEI